MTTQEQSTPDGFVTSIVADIRGTVTCHYPCVPECPREHEWDEKAS